MFVARRSDRLVKMLCIRLPKVIGGQISASAKPAVYRGFHRGVFIEFKIAVVCMDSRYHRILRVYHKRESASPEPTIVHIKVFPDRFGKFSMDSADIYTPFLDRKSTRLNSSHVASSYAVFRLKKQTGAD